MRGTSRAGIRGAIGGLVVGAVAVPLIRGPGLIGFVFLVLAALLLVRMETRAAGGGILVSFGLWWAYLIQSAIERCAAFDRQPGGSCEIYGTDEQTLLAISVAMLGVALVALSLAERRRRA